MTKNGFAPTRLLMEACEFCTNQKCCAAECEVMKEKQAQVERGVDIDICRDCWAKDCMYKERPVYTGNNIKNIRIGLKELLDNDVINAIQLRIIKRMGLNYINHKVMEEGILKEYLATETLEKISLFCIQKARKVLSHKRDKPMAKLSISFVGEDIKGEYVVGKKKLYFYISNNKYSTQIYTSKVVRKEEQLINTIKTVLLKCDPKKYFVFKENTEVKVNKSMFL